MIKRLVHWFNREFGSRHYFEGEDGKVYIKEGNNPPEELLEHLKRYHPKEYQRIKEYGRTQGQKDVL